MVDVQSVSKVKVVPDLDPRWAQCRLGDQQACNSLVEDHLPLLAQVASIYCLRAPSHVEYDEIHSYGVFGLIVSVKTYDPQRAGFRTHAVFRIRNAIVDGVRVQDWATKSFRAQHREALRMQGELATQLERKPTDEELGVALGHDGDYVRRLREENRVSYPASLAELQDDDGSHDSIPALATSRDITEQVHAARKYMQAMVQWTNTLTPQQQIVWALRFYRDMPPLTISRRIGLRQVDVYAEIREILASFENFVVKLKSEVDKS